MMTEAYSFKKKYSENLNKRKALFKKLLSEAKKQLKSEGYNLTPELVLDTQITLALQRGIVPPMWTGFASCERCGCVPAQAGIAYLKVNRCSWCDCDDVEVKVTGGINRLLYWVNKKRPGLLLAPKP